LPIADGLPLDNTVTAPLEARVARAFVFVGDAFGLDLRTRQQVFEYADAASSALRAEGNHWQLHALYLFFLAALLQRSVEKFDQFVANDSDETKRSDILRSVLTNHSTVFRENESQGKSVKRRVSANEIFVKYHEYSSMSMSALQKSAAQGRLVTYPASLIEALPYTAPAGSTRPGTALYPALIRAAGFLRS